MSRFTDIKNILLEYRDTLSLTLPDSEFFYLLNKYSGIRKPSENVQRKDMERLNDVLKIY